MTEIEKNLLYILLIFTQWGVFVVDISSLYSYSPTTPHASFPCLIHYYYNMGSSIVAGQTHREVALLPDRHTGK
jgi:hypothetical protein